MPTIGNDTCESDSDARGCCTIEMRGNCGAQC